MQNNINANVIDETSEIESLSANVYNTLKTSMNNGLFIGQNGGAKKKRGSKKVSKKGSKKRSKRVFKRVSKKGSKKGSKKESKKGSKRSSALTIEMLGGRKKLEEDDIQDGGKKKKGSKKRISKKMSKRKSKSIKKTLPEKLQEFQKLVKHLASALGHSPQLFKLAKTVRDEVMKTNPNASIQDITKKSMKYFDDNKDKLSAEYEKLKASKGK